MDRADALKAHLAMSTLAAPDSEVIDDSENENEESVELLGEPTQFFTPTPGSPTASDGATVPLADENTLAIPDSMKSASSVQNNDAEAATLVVEEDQEDDDDDVVLTGHTVPAEDPVQVSDDESTSAKNTSKDSVAASRDTLVVTDESSNDSDIICGNTSKNITGDAATLCVSPVYDSDGDTETVQLDGETQAYGKQARVSTGGKKSVPANKALTQVVSDDSEDEEAETVQLDGETQAYGLGGDEATQAYGIIDSESGDDDDNAADGKAANEATEAYGANEATQAYGVIDNDEEDDTEAGAAGCGADEATQAYGLGTKDGSDDDEEIVAVLSESVLDSEAATPPPADGLDGGETQPIELDDDDDDNDDTVEDVTLNESDPTQKYDMCETNDKEEGNGAVKERFVCLKCSVDILYFILSYFINNLNVIKS